MADEPKLTGKQRMFCEHYIACCFNATEAARRAGYAGNSVTLGQVGAENLKKPQIAAYIAERVSEVCMSADEVLLRLGRMGRGSMRPFIDTGEPLKGETPHINLSAEAAIENLDLIKKLKTKSMMKIKQGAKSVVESLLPETPDEALEIVEIEIEIHDPKDALIQIGRYHKLFTDKAELNAKVEIEDANFTDTERLERLLALANAARARGSGGAPSGAGGDGKG